MEESKKEGKEKGREERSIRIGIYEIHHFLLRATV
jgi:hypothetical protein